MINLKRWKCSICSYIFEDSVAPNICPICKASSKEFKEVIETNIDFIPNNNFKIVIIGSGAAGYYAAKTAKSKNKNCSVEIISADSQETYFKPMLCDYLNKDIPLDKLNVCNTQWYEDNNIILHLNKVVERIDTLNKKVLIENSAPIEYDKLILATGSHAVIPPITGKEKNRVFSLKTIEDSQKIKKFIKDVESVVIVGGGILGLEIADQLSKQGINVTIVEKNHSLMFKHLDKTGAKLIKQIVENSNIKVILNQTVKEILGFTRVTGVKLSNNNSIRTDLVLFTIGTLPNTNIADKSGIAYRKGILVNEKMETNMKDIYACGDCAQFNEHIYGNWSAATEMGTICGANSIGATLKFTDFVPSTLFNSFGIRIFSCGVLNSSLTTQKFQYLDINKKTYKRFYFQNDKLVGAILIGDIKKSENLINAIKEGKSYTDLIKEDIAI